MSTERPLTARQQRFAELYAGDATRAAELAGYRGTRASLSTIGSRLLGDERIAAAIASRKAATAAEPPEVPEGVAADGMPTERTPKATLEAIMRDETTLASHRVRAAELLRREELAAAPGQVDVLAAQRAATQKAINAMRERERIERVCARCGGPLRERAR